MPKEEKNQTKPKPIIPNSISTFQQYVTQHSSVCFLALISKPHTEPYLLWKRHQVTNSWELLWYLTATVILCSSAYHQAGKPLQSLPHQLSQQPTSKGKIHKRKDARGFFVFLEYIWAIQAFSLEIKNLSLTILKRSRKAKLFSVHYQVLN